MKSKRRFNDKCLTFLQRRNTDLRVALGRGLFDIECFQAMRAPEAEIGELKRAWSDLLQEYQEITQKIKELEDKKPCSGLMKMNRCPKLKALSHLTAEVAYA